MSYLYYLIYGDNEDIDPELAWCPKQRERKHLLLKQILLQRLRLKSIPSEKEKMEKLITEVKSNVVIKKKPTVPVKQQRRVHKRVV